MVAYNPVDQKTKVFQIVKGEVCVVKDDLGGIVGDLRSATTAVSLPIIGCRPGFTMWMGT